VNSHQAKEILLRYRPGTADEQEPDVRQALEFAAADPDLSGWLEQHSATQSAFRQHLRQIPVPEGLKQQILSERPTSRTAAKAPYQPSARWLAVAAAIVLLFALATVFWPKQPNVFAEFRSRMSGIVLREYPRMDLETSDLARIRSFLGQNQAHGDYVLPKPLEATPSTGCAILPWRGQRVSMICFDSGQKSDPTLKSDVFLFVVDHAVVPKAPGQSPQFSQLNKLATLSWTSGTRTYVLAGYGDEAFIRKYL
jgi:hypothetical protein